MRDSKIARQCSLFKANYLRIINSIECSVSKDLDQRLVIRDDDDDDEVIAALCEEIVDSVIRPIGSKGCPSS